MILSEKPLVFPNYTRALTKVSPAAIEFITVRGSEGSQRTTALVDLWKQQRHGRHDAAAQRRSRLELMAPALALPPSGRADAQRARQALG